MTTDTNDGGDKKCPECGRDMQWEEGDSGDRMTPPTPSAWGCKCGHTIEGRPTLVPDAAKAGRQGESELSFSALRQANDDRAKQWNPDGPPLSMEFAVIELCGEAGELANAVKKYLRWKAGIAGGVESLEPVEDETADVVICCDLLARRLGFDLGAAVARKFNKTSDKHGFTVKLPTAGMADPAATIRELRCAVELLADEVATKRMATYLCAGSCQRHERTTATMCAVNANPIATAALARAREEGV